MKKLKAWAVYNTFTKGIQTRPFNTITTNKDEAVQYFYYLEHLLPGNFQIIKIEIVPQSTK
jgi:hypothetical protein